MNPNLSYRDEYNIPVLCTRCDTPLPHPLEARSVETKRDNTSYHVEYRLVAKCPHCGNEEYVLMYWGTYPVRGE